MESLNTYGPWALTVLSAGAAAFTHFRPKRAPQPSTIAGLAGIAGGAQGLMKFLAELPQHVDDIKRIATAIAAILDAVARAFPQQPPKPPQ